MSDIDEITELLQPVGTFATPVHTTTIADLDEEPGADDYEIHLSLPSLTHPDRRYVVTAVVDQDPPEPDGDYFAPVYQYDYDGREGWVYRGGPYRWTETHDHQLIMGRLNNEYVRGADAGDNLEEWLEFHQRGYAYGWDDRDYKYLQVITPHLWTEIWGNPAWNFHANARNNLDGSPFKEYFEGDCHGLTNYRVIDVVDGEQVELSLTDPNNPETWGYYGEDDVRSAALDELQALRDACDSDDIVVNVTTVTTEVRTPAFKED